MNFAFLFLLIVIVVWIFLKQKGLFRKCRWLTLLFAAVTLLLAIFSVKAFLFPSFTLPQPTGEHDVLTADFTWTDESRLETFDDSGESRKVTVRIWYPKETGSYPLVLFDHGAFGVLESNTSTCTELASNGYVAVSIGHPYHSTYLQDTDGHVTIVDMDFLKNVMETQNSGAHDPQTEYEKYCDSQEWMALRGADDNFVLDTILALAAAGNEAPLDRIDTEKIGMFGHSMGGAASVLLGRQRGDIDAVIDLEGTMLGEYAGFENGHMIFEEAPYPIPVLDVYSGKTYEEATEFYAGSDMEYVNFYLGERAADYRVAILEDAGHLNFTDLPLVSPFLAKLLGTGDADPKACIEEVNALVLSWFDTYLK